MGTAPFESSDCVQLYGAYPHSIATESTLSFNTSVPSVFFSPSVFAASVVFSSVLLDDEHPANASIHTIASADTDNNFLFIVLTPFL
ncbi:hypothetical protein SDC9_164666 [bioreactor metagenome]|uniref:Uncharacterized protein n=1 Tax=bioreactor metagenome TaxID=1076179 RepID=A0A645FZG5_9ZZZZ